MSSMSTPRTSMERDQNPSLPKRSRPNSIIVNECQKGNPLLNYVRNVPWEHGDILADYELGKTTCALFLSVKFHKLHPNYIYERIKDLGKLYSLRLLLIYIDTGDYSKTLRELTRVSTLLNFTIILAWSNEEAARYLETFKAFEHKSADAIKTRSGDTMLEKVHSLLSNIRSVNKTDTLTLSTQFNTVADILNADERSLRLCPGFGDQKIRRFKEAMDACFDSNLYAK